jgi:signal transduction histidine kinase
MYTAQLSTDESDMESAYERERTRLSRELHDDIAQRLALVSTELGILRQLLTNTSDAVRKQVDWVAAETANIGSDLHRIARGLHPAGLERLGLSASLRCYCAQLAQARRITIDVALGEVPDLDMDAALGMYRIAQEALHNVVKHSGATCASVSLATVRGDLVLRVTDRGVGFDLQTMCSKNTLGLVSMRERARLVHARLVVSSKPRAGTTVEARLRLRGALAPVSS